MAKGLEGKMSDKQLRHNLTVSSPFSQMLLLVYSSKSGVLGWLLMSFDSVTRGQYTFQFTFVNRVTLNSLYNLCALKTQNISTHFTPDINQTCCMQSSSEYSSSSVTVCISFSNSTVSFSDLLISSCSPLRLDFSISYKTVDCFHSKKQ